MDSKKQWKLIESIEKMTGFIPTNHLFFVLNSNNGENKYSLIKLIYRHKSDLGYDFCRFEDIENKHIIETVFDPGHEQKLKYEDPILYNGDYKTSYLVALKDVLTSLGMANIRLIHQSQVSALIRKYNESKMGIYYKKEN